MTTISGSPPRETLLSLAATGTEIEIEILIQEGVPESPALSVLSTADLSEEQGEPETILL